MKNKLGIPQHSTPVPALLKSCSRLFHSISQFPTQAHPAHVAQSSWYARHGRGQGPEALMAWDSDSRWSLRQSSGTPNPQEGKANLT